MKKSLLAFLVLVLPFSVMASTIVPGGFVSGTWTAAGSPYIIQASITVGTSLTIQAGVDVRFGNSSGMTVLGKLNAIGTVSQPVIFEADDTTGWSHFNNWWEGGMSGIYFNNTGTDTSILDHCIIRDAKTTPTTNNLVCINGYNSFFILKNSEIYHNYMSGAIPCPIIILYNSPQILNNSIHDNFGMGPGGVGAISANLSGTIISGNEIYNNSGQFAGAIKLEGDSTFVNGVPTVSNNYIHNNRAGLGGGAIYASGRVLIAGNDISFNRATHAGGGILLNAPRAKLISNKINNNSDSTYYACFQFNGGGGIYASYYYPTDSVEFSNNLIANNESFFRGGGVEIVGNSRGTTIFENNNILNNNCYTGFFTGGIEINPDTSNVVFRNNILWGNTAVLGSGQRDSIQVLVWSNASVFVENNCMQPYSNGPIEINVNTVITGNSATNTSINPGFVSPTAGAGISFNADLADWHLNATSPCIDAGSNQLFCAPVTQDFYIDPRYMGTFIDIGIVEFPSQSGISENQLSTINFYPNPANDFLFLENENEFSNVRIMDLLGNLLIDKNYGNGIDVSNLSPGIYLFSVQNKNEKISSSKFVKQ